MLTLFPRIKPNPLPPRSLPPEPLGAKPVLVDPAADAAPPISEALNEASNSEKTTAIAVSSAEASQPVAAEGASPASSVTDSDLFAAFMSGMATAGSDPFVVEITSRPSSKVAPQVLGSEEQSRRPTSEPAVVLEELSSESVKTKAAQCPLAPEQNPEVVPEALPEEESSRNALPVPQLYIAAANIFDELDILHEAAISPIEATEREPQGAEPALQPEGATESPSGYVVEVAEVGPEATSAENPASAAEEAAPLANLRPSAPTEIGVAEAGSPSSEISGESAQDASNAYKNQSAIDAPEPRPMPAESASFEAAPPETREPASPQEAQQELSGNVQSSQVPHAANPARQKEVALTNSPAPELTKKAASGARFSPPKPKRSKGTLCVLARVPEPEAMEDSGEVEAYSSAAAQSHLDAIDDTFVAHAQLLLKGRERGRALDIGTGPGQIVIKLGYRLTLWKFIGIDRSAAMIEKAGESLATAGELAGRVEFRVADGNALEFPDKTFDLVICNSVLHHIAEPQKLFSEIARVVKPGGAILLRDLRRPSRWGYSYHVWKHGKHYTGEMRRLFMASAMAAYTEDELQTLVASSALRDARVFRHGKTHIGFARAIATIAERKR